MMGHKKRNTEKEGGALALDPAEGSDRLLDSELARGGQNGFRCAYRLSILRRWEW